MKCPICKNGETGNGYASIHLECNTITPIFKHVLADICKECGEESIAENISVQPFKAAKQAVKVGAQVDVREYLAA